jgi:hypothetical protein
VLVFTGITSTYQAEICQGVEIQGKQSVLKTAKSTAEIHSVRHNVYVAIETGRELWAVVRYPVRLRKSDRDRAYAKIHKYSYDNLSADKQNR